MVYCLRLVEPIKDHCFWIMHSNISIDFFSYVYFGKKDIPINNCLNKKIATWKYEIGTNSDKIIPQGIQTPVSRHLFPKGIETRVSWHLFPKGNKTPVSWHLIPKGIKTPVSWLLFPDTWFQKESRHLFPDTCFPPKKSDTCFLTPVSQNHIQTPVSQKPNLDTCSQDFACAQDFACSRKKNQFSQYFILVVKV